ncbi:hypothetical protein JTE90_017688 [Oedothorax gibbosus]|uniref:Uncharacterized protein n=1 Tax=Oedothorax gibbosus TaxID=931172 RepID=A0AAV6UZK2_9ARAC|nr:hypothetical protein JTE90_017688 [Oedothorax gibbosus]
MGANKSKSKENESELKPKVENDLSNEPSVNDGKETSKEAVEQNVNIVAKDNVEKNSHDENVKKDEKEDPASEDIIETDDKSSHDDKCPSSEHAKGIICNATHICSKDSKFQIPNITDEELAEYLDTSLNNAVSNSDKLERVGNEDGKIVIKKTTVEVINLEPPPSPEKKSGKHVTWSTKVQAKNTEDGTVSEEELKQCDSCQSLVEDIEKRKVKVPFVKSKTQKDKDSSSDIQDEDMTREIYICDSCDLECSKKILKK